MRKKRKRKKWNRDELQHCTHCFMFSVYCPLFHFRCDPYFIDNIVYAFIMIIASFS